MSMSLSAEVLRSNDGGAVFQLTPSHIHVAWWVVWISQLQTWVKEKMASDAAALDEVLNAEVRTSYVGYENASDEEIERWREKAKQRILRERPHLRRFEVEAPALFAMFELRAQLRSKKRGKPGKEESDGVRSEKGSTPTKRRKKEVTPPKDPDNDDGSEDPDFVDFTLRPPVTGNKPPGNHPYCTTLHPYAPTYLVLIV